jgi:hypothetical protein
LQTAALNYKLIKKIKDERFDEELIDQYDLLIHIGPRDLQIGVIHSETERMLLMEDYVFPELPLRGELTHLLDQLFDGHPFLKAAFWKRIKICIKNNKFIQVPEAMFVKGAEAEYLRFNARIEDDEEVLSIVNTQAKAVTVFAVQNALRQWLTRLYPNNTAVFMHQSSALIEGIIQYAQQRKENPLYIYVDRFKLHILSCKEGKLLYYNQFVIKQFSDYIKYIMLVMKSLNLNQSTSRVLLWGYVGRNSPHYHEFYKYISNVSFGSRPKHLAFGYMFDEVQDHHFFDLYSMHLLGRT